MIITTCIADDEQHAVDKIAGYVKRTPDLELLGAFIDPLQILDLINSDKPPMLTFLDIDMPEISGLELAGIINKSSLVVFTTSYRDFAVDAFDKEAIDFLLKPITYGRFIKCIDKARAMLLLQNDLNVKERAVLYVKTETRGKLVKVVIKEISHIESKLNYCFIHVNNNIIKAYISLPEVLSELPQEDFIRTHRSYIINRHMISSLESGHVRLNGKTTIPLSRSYHDSFYAQLNPFILSASKKD